MERNFFLLSRDMNPYEEKPAETGSREAKKTVQYHMLKVVSEQRGKLSEQKGFGKMVSEQRGKVSEQKCFGRGNYEFERGLKVLTDFSPAA